MARINAQIKLGYYPLPPELASAVADRLEAPLTEAIALDPCCGTGEALATIGKGLPLRLYGIEVDESRAAEAISRLETVLNAPLETTLLQGVCQLLYLNPPYEHEVGIGGKRVEVTFLDTLLDTLCEHGVLVFAVPYRVLWRLADSLSRNFRNVTIFKGDERFQQVLIFGIRRQAGDPGSDRDRTNFRGQASMPYGQLPEVSDDSINAKYRIPCADGENFLHLRRVGIDFEKLEADFLNAQGFKALGSSGLVPIPRNQRPLQIIHPLTPGLTAILMQAGMFDGQVFEPDNPLCCVVKGSTVFHHMEQTEEISEMVTEIREIDAPVTRITAASFREKTVFDLYPDKTLTFKNEETS